MYDEALATQPNYSSQDPTYDMEAENDEVTNGYDYIERPQGAIHTPQFKAASHSPVRMEASGDDFYDVEEHTYAMVNVNKKKKKLSSSAANNEEHTAEVQDTPVNPTPVPRNEASQKEDDFYDAEEHTYSVVNVKYKKTAVSGKGEGE